MYNHIKIFILCRFNFNRHDEDCLNWIKFRIVSNIFSHTTVKKCDSRQNLEVICGNAGSGKAFLVNDEVSPKNKIN